jgi:hypothetical protein
LRLGERRPRGHEQAKIIRGSRSVDGNHAAGQGVNLSKERSEAAGKVVQKDMTRPAAISQPWPELQPSSNSFVAAPGAEIGKGLVAVGIDDVAGAAVGLAPVEFERAGRVEWRGHRRVQGL